jgi:hypothetical protein
MPQPIWPDPPEGAFVHRPRILLSKRPQHAAGMGAVAAEWAALEERLNQALAFSFSFFATSKEGGYALTKTTLATIESLLIRLEVMGHFSKPASPSPILIFIKARSTQTFASGVASETSLFTAIGVLMTNIQITSSRTWMAAT